MKKIIALAALACAFTSLSAQQVESPEFVGSDVVVLRIATPASVKNAHVVADFIPGGKGKMVRNKGGFWEYMILKTLSPDMYLYAFDLDGERVLDPVNPDRVRDIATDYSYFILPGEGANEYLDTNVAHGKVTQQTWQTSTHGARPVTIYTPAGYDDPEDTMRYPVLYLLHGLGGDETAWTTLGRAAQILDNMIASDKVKPMIVVMPNSNFSTASGAGADMVPTMDGTFETEFPGLIAYVDSTYRTFARRESRAIAGLSMGGFHAMNISRHYPATFDYVGLFSAAMMNKAQDLSSPVYTNVDEELAAQFADGLGLYFMACGKDDFLFADNQEYYTRLKAAGYPVYYVQTGGGHDWSNWRAYLKKFLPLLFQ